MGAAIDIRGLRKVYRVGDQKIVALNTIDLKIEQGEVCCLLGTSGSGKSTLLNMMAGLEKPTKGQVIVMNKHVEKMNEDELALFRQKHVGFIFQSYNLFSSLTALENVTMPLVFRRVSPKKREMIGKKILKAVGLEKYHNRKPNQMSGGQQQRVGIARAFVGNQSIIFADEPTGNLDSRTTVEIMKLMLSMVKENKQTLIIVTHDRTIAQYADRIVYILDGNIKSIEVNENRIDILSDSYEYKDEEDQAKEEAKEEVKEEAEEEVKEEVKEEVIANEELDIESSIEKQNS